MESRRTALVTGAARRVGRAIALRLAGAGMDVAFTYNNSEAEATELAGEIRAAGREAVAIQANLFDVSAAIAAIESAFRARFSRLDVLVNNASAYEPGRLTDTDLALMRRMWAIHAEAPLLLARAFAPLLAESRGTIINMVDLLAEKPWPQYMAYCASKAALANITVSLARQLAPDVTVNGISPGVVDWPDDMPADQREAYLKRVPLARPGTPEDVANLVHYLCTEGKYITGQIVRLDGGRSTT